jgi:acetylornithine deacetylase/succinyl-diaminopimelate desuccinylase-like protein
MGRLCRILLTRPHGLTRPRRSTLPYGLTRPRGQFGIPAVAYGPRARNIHAADESVELASIVAGARTLARFLAGYYAAGGLRTGGAS